MKSVLAILLSSVLLLVFSASTLFAQQTAKAIVDKECAKCHNLKKVYTASKDAAGWEKTLDRMIKKGAVIKPEEKDPVLKYLRTLNK